MTGQMESEELEVAQCTGCTAFLAWESVRLLVMTCRTSRGLRQRGVGQSRCHRHRGARLFRSSLAHRIWQHFCGEGPFSGNMASPIHASCWAADFLTQVKAGSSRRG